MLKYLAGYLASAAVFLAMDFTWLGIASTRLYKPILGDLLADSISIAPALAFYLIYIGGVLVLAVTPGLERGGWTRAATLGAVLGFVAYGTYDLTNQATLRTWSSVLTFADMGWGTIATAVAAGLGCVAAQAAARALGSE